MCRVHEMPKRADDGAVEDEFDFEVDGGVCAVKEEDPRRSVKYENSSSELDKYIDHQESPRSLNLICSTNKRNGQ